MTPIPGGCCGGVVDVGLMRALHLVVGSLPVVLGCASPGVPPARHAPAHTACDEVARIEAMDPTDTALPNLRDECRWRREFLAYAEARQACVRSEECSIVAADYPLNLSVAVSWGRADEVVAKRDALAREAQGRVSCTSCGGVAASPPLASCVNGRCELEEPTLEGTNGSGAD